MPCSMTTPTTNTNNTTTTKSSANGITLLSKSTILPTKKSTLPNLKLSASDLPMLSCHYIQKGCLFTNPTSPFPNLIPPLKLALAKTLSLFPALAGRLTTDSANHIHISSNDAGADFLHASAPHISLRHILSPLHVPDCVKHFFALDNTVSYDGHFLPLLAVQVTQLSDGIFIGCSVNHAVVDGTSIWNFFNTLAEVCRIGGRKITKIPDFSRDSVLISDAVLKIPEAGFKVTFDVHAPVKERIFSFTREAILRLKEKTNNNKWNNNNNNSVESMAKQSHDNGKITSKHWLGKIRTETEVINDPTVQISSFQSLCALLWRAVTRARKFPANKTTTFRMAVNCRHRLEPKLNPYYFGNAIQSIPTYATAGEVLSRDLRWCADQLNKNVQAHDNDMVRGVVQNWERDPRCFPLGNFDGGMITMGSSPRFPMYENDFGWGKPIAIRSGRANKFDGKISAFPGREGGGSVDLEVLLAPETMAGLESDPEFMQFVTVF